MSPVDRGRELLESRAGTSATSESCRWCLLENSSSRLPTGTTSRSSRSYAGAHDALTTLQIESAPTHYTLAACYVANAAQSPELHQCTDKTRSPHVTYAAEGDDAVYGGPHNEKSTIVGSLA